VIIEFFVTVTKHEIHKTMPSSHPSVVGWDSRRLPVNSRIQLKSTNTRIRWPGAFLLELPFSLFQLANSWPTTDWLAEGRELRPRLDADYDAPTQIGRLSTIRRLGLAS